MSKIRRPLFSLLFTFFALMLLITAGGASAQDDADWTVWLYNQETGTFTQLSSTGETLQQIDVPHSTGYDWYGYYAAVSPDGQSVAYGEASGEDMNSFNAEIVLYDVNQDRMLATYPLMPNLNALTTSMELFNAATSSITFDAESDSVAFGYAYRYNPNNPDVYHWQIVAIDFTEPAPAPFYILDSAVASSRLGTRPDALYNVTDLQYVGTTVRFTLQPVFTGQGLSAVTAEWNIETNGIQVVEDVVSLFGDEANGLRVELLAPAGQPSSEEMMGGPSFTRVSLQDAETGEQDMIFELEEGWVMGAKFVQNSERIAVTTFHPDHELATLVVIDLEGKEHARFEDVANVIGDIWSTREGFVFAGYNRESILRLYSVDLLAGTAPSLVTDDIMNMYSISVVDAE
jgi:hypothetical protein